MGRFHPTEGVTMCKKRIGAFARCAVVLSILSFGTIQTPGQSPQPDIVTVWLTTFCTTDDKGIPAAALAQAGGAAEPFLIQAAENGPSADYVASISPGFGQEYDGIQAWITAFGSDAGLSAADIQDAQAVTRDQFIANQVNNAVLNYRSRALVGLGLIGGPAALQVLQSFANNTSSPLQPVAQQALANFAGPTTMAGNITSKSGPANARVWTVTFTNNGPGVAMGVQINSMNLTQTFGAACTPVVTTPVSLPLSVGSIAPAGSDSAAITINFTGCPANARFTANISFSANSGTLTGTVTRYNQYQ
jgi:hypothetical protein